MVETNKENQVLKLSDGRNLGYGESGDLNGIPIFHFQKLFFIKSPYLFAFPV